MEQAKSLIGPCVFAVIAITFGVLSIRYQNAWAQGIATSSFTAMCVAFQFPSNSPKLPN